MGNSLNDCYIIELTHDYGVYTSLNSVFSCVDILLRDYKYPKVRVSRVCKDNIYNSVLYGTFSLRK